MITVLLIPVLGLLGILDERREVVSWTAPNKRDTLLINVIKGRAYGPPSRTEILGLFQGKLVRKTFYGPSDACVENLRGRTLFIIDNYAGTKDGNFFVGEYHRGTFKTILAGLRFDGTRVQFSKSKGTLSSAWFDYDTQRMLKGVWRLDVERGRAVQISCVPLSE